MRGRKDDQGSGKRERQEEREDRGPNETAGGKKRGEVEKERKTGKGGGRSCTVIEEGRGVLGCVPATRSCKVTDPSVSSHTQPHFAPPDARGQQNRSLLSNRGGNLAQAKAENQAQPT